jgi:hypothetical protein
MALVLGQTRSRYPVVPATKSRDVGRSSLLVLGTLAVFSDQPPEEAEGTALERRL